MKHSIYLKIAVRMMIVMSLVFLASPGIASHAPKKTQDSEAKRQAFLEAAMESIPKEGEDKTLSPYFFVMSDDPSVDQLPLKSTRADVDIAGVIADVRVTQVYKNEGKQTLEAIYIFPASTRAAVYAMRMTVGKRVIEAEIKERAAARKAYEEARKQGKTASLLEQQRPNVFQMNVANILPGDEIKVELKYTELLVPEENIYTFVYPTVVGPRYSNVKEEGASAQEKWVKNPYLHSGEKATYAFGLDVNLNTGIPIDKLTSPSHKIAAEYVGKERAHVTLPESKDVGNRDFVLKYGLAGGSIQSGLMLYPGERENFFLMMMEPPKRVDQAQIVPREYIFIVDISGSMHGFPLDVTKKLMRNLFGKLRPNDAFNVMLFAGSNAVMAEKSLPANKANLKRAIDVIEQQRGGGGTELIPALKRALALPRTKGASRIVVVVTDGYVSVEKDAFELIRKNLGQANLFAFGIGNSVNRYLIEGMARAGQGEPFVLLGPSEAAAKAEQFRQYIQSPILQGIKVAFKGFGAYDVEPPANPDLFALKPLIVYGKYKGEPKGEVVITGHTPGKAYRKVMKVEPAMASKDNAALEYLWARERILSLSDMQKLDKSDTRVKEITALGLKYHLMTEYTSFVAIDKVKRADGKYVTVKQPLPLPQGVSDYAVGGGVMPRMAKMSVAAAPTSVLREEAADLQAPPPPRKEVLLQKVKIEAAGDAAFTESSVRAAIKLGQLKRCWTASGGKRPGTIALSLIVDPAGNVTAMKLVRDTIKDASLRVCVEQALRAMKLPKRSTGKPESVHLVLSFR